MHSRALVDGGADVGGIGAGMHLCLSFCRQLVYPDNDIARLDDCVHTHALYQLQLVHNLIGYRGHKPWPTQVDTNVGGGLALRYINDGPIELIACA